MKKITVKILSALLMLSMVFSSNVFAAEKTNSAWDSFVGLFSATSSTDVGVEYRGHIQNKGDFPLDGSWIQGPNELGTRGESLRMEGFWIQLTNEPADLTIKYNVHVQNEGWLFDENDTTNWAENGDFAGTRAKSQRIEAVKIVLVDAADDESIDYDVMYQGHVQNVGDVPQNDPEYTGTTGWYENGDQLGTTGSGLRLEALKVKIVQKDADLTAYNAAKAAKVQADYTTASWTAYQAVVAANVVTADDLQSEVNDATEAIVAAQANLVKVLKVESVSATNLKNLVVTFNGEVNKDTVTTTNLRVYDGVNQVTGVTVAVSADNKTAFITNNTSYTQLKEYKVVVENVATKSDATNKVAKTEKMVTTVDTTLPTVESVTVKSPKTLEILFSEPIQTGTLAGQFPTAAGVTDRVKIDGINAYFASVDVTKLNTENKITVTLGTGMTVGDHKVVVSGLNDFANLPIATKEFTATVVADTTVPAVTSASATTRDKVTVTFNKPVDASTVTANTNIKIFVGGAPNTIAGVTTTDNQTFVLDMTGAELSLASIVDSSVKVKNVKDAYGNEITTEQVFAFTATDDKVAPTVTSVTVNSDNTLEVTFSKDVAFTAAGIELYKDSTKLTNAMVATGKVINTVTSKKVYTVTITGGNLLTGNHTLKFIKDTTRDTSVRQNYLAETTSAISFIDKVAPTIQSAVYVNEATDTVIVDGDVLDSKITIYFDKTMDNATLLNKANYLLAGTPLADVVGASLEAATDNKSVTININRTAPQTQFAFSTATDLRVIAVKDAAGNTLSSSFVNANLGSGGKNIISAFTGTAAFNAIVDTTKVEAVAKNQVKIYAVTGQLISNIDPNKVKFAKAGVADATLQVMNVAIAADMKSAVLTLNNPLGADAKISGSAIALYADADAITTTTSVKNTVLALGSAVTLTDKIKATVQPVDGKFVVTANKVVLTFDEALTAAGANFVIRDSAGTQLAPADYTITYPTATTIAVQITKAGFNGKVTIALLNNVTLADPAGNFVNDFTAIESKDALVTPIGVTLGATAETAKGVAPVNQIAEIQVTAGVTTTGNISVDGVAIGVTAAETAANVATKIVAASASLPNWTVALKPATTDTLLFTAKTAAANAAVTFNAGGTSVALGAQTNTVSGAAEVKEVGTTQVTAAASNTGNLTVRVATGGVTLKDVTVAVTSGDTAATVAGKIRTALAADATVTGTYAVSGATDNIILTQTGTGADVTISVTLV